MSETVTKTLQATLATPTTGKEQRLQNLLDTYRDALHDAFDAGRTRCPPSTISSRPTAQDAKRLANATVHRETSENPSQMTLAACSD
ncbi:hypothetical protein HYG82_21025 [Natrinema halophilum]|nr:hypothetical protein [Natrinema halophilum]UHQ96067.1 hypothetical protein HYG82_21025 [Natrinema halophilum]